LENTRTRAFVWRSARKEVQVEGGCSGGYARGACGWHDASCGPQRQEGLTALRVCLSCFEHAGNTRPFSRHNGGMRSEHSYRSAATSLPGFLQQLAVHYMGHGYLFFVTGNIPEGKDPARTDAKILAQYPVALSRWAKARRKRAGLGNVHYMRYGRFFVILA